MGMEASSSFYEASFNVIKNNCCIIAICSSHFPTIATSTYANVVHTGSSTGLCFCKTTNITSTSFTIQASTPGGKALVLTTTKMASLQVVNNPSQGGAAVGLAKHIVMATTVSIQYVTTCTTLSLTTSDQATVPSFRLCLQNPTSS